MEEDNARSVMKRLLRSSAKVAQGQGITPVRSLRLSLARSAERSVGLTLSVGDVTNIELTLDEMLAAINPGMMLIELRSGEACTGFAAIDLQLRTALVEVQTLGVQHATSCVDRPISAGDVALAVPFLDAFLNDFARSTDDPALEAWAKGISAKARIPDLRAVKMMLADLPMRQVTLCVILGKEDRKGYLSIALPAPIAKPSRGGPVKAVFADQLSEAVMEAPAVLHAVLPDVELPLHEVEAFEAGNLVSLPGLTVGSVLLRGPDGSRVAQARLGQSAGARAVRVQAPDVVQMRETISQTEKKPCDAAVNELNAPTLGETNSSLNERLTIDVSE